MDLKSNRLTFDAHAPLELLIRQPYRFDFFQAVRLLTWSARRAESSLSGQSQRPVGEDWLPNEELVRFRTDIGNTFASGQISSLRIPEDGQRNPVPELTVSFMGLAGAGGVLPDHYTQLLIDRTRAKDFAFREFLDLFNHRLISHFFRAWNKCHFFAGYETARGSSPADEDLFTRALYCLVGLGTSGLRGRQEITDESFLYYAGHFAHSPRTAISLEQIIFDYLNVPVSIQQFQGQWLYLRSSDQTRLTSDPTQPDNNRLGVTAIAGERIWGIENKFRIRLGPLSYASFREYMPGGKLFESLGQLARTYVGPAFDFDVQLVLDKGEIPLCMAGRNTLAQLGWNTWLLGVPAESNVDDAVFNMSGSPNR